MPTLRCNKYRLAGGCHGRTMIIDPVAAKKRMTKAIQLSMEYQAHKNEILSRHQQMTFSLGPQDKRHGFDLYQIQTMCRLELLTALSDYMAAVLGAIAEEQFKENGPNEKTIVSLTNSAEKIAKWQEKGLTAYEVEVAMHNLKPVEMEVE